MGSRLDIDNVHGAEEGRVEPGRLRVQVCLEGGVDEVCKLDGDPGACGRGDLVLKLAPKDDIIGIVLLNRARHKR